MSVSQYNARVSTDHPEPVSPLGGTATVTVSSGDTVYYLDRPSVSASNNSGSLTSGQSASFTSQQYLVSASYSSVQISVDDTPSITIPVSELPASVVIDSSATPKGIDSTGVVDTNVLAYNNASGKWKPTPAPGGADPLTYPEGYGAVGDGVTDDSVALKAWAASGKLQLGLKAGKTYLHQQQLTISTAGVRLYGNGATIKRSAQGVTTTTTTIASGTTTQITVAATSGGSGATAWQLKVGDSIVVEKSGTFDNIPKTITNIAGNVVTVGTPFLVSLSGTINVRQTLFQIAVGVADCVISDLVLDGNLTNCSWGRWQNSVGILSYGQADNLVIQRCKILNVYGDALQPGLGDHQRVEFCTITNCAGRGIVWGGNSTNQTYGSRTAFNDISNVDIDTAVAGTDGTGCIDISDVFGDVLIHGNRMTNAVTGVGGINADNSNITITNNEIETMSALAIDGTGTGNAIKNVVVSGNRISSTGGISITPPGSSVSLLMSNWTITNNILEESKILISLAQQIAIANNIFTSAGTSLTFITLSNGGNASLGPKDITITGNAFVGGSVGVNLSTLCSDVTITGNLFDTPNLNAVNASATAIKNVSITGNMCIGSANNNGVIIVTGPVVVSGNTLDLSAGGQGGIFVTATTARAVVTNNTLIGMGTFVKGISVATSATNTVVKNNTATPPSTGTLMQSVITDSGTGTLKFGNTVSDDASAGTATLVAGTVTVSTKEARTGDVVQMERTAVGGTPGFLSFSVVNNTSVTITSSSNTDTSTVAWRIVH